MVIALAEKHKRAHNVACDNITRSKNEEAMTIGKLLLYSTNQDN
jgi:hypothetical protein